MDFKELFNRTPNIISNHFVEKNYKEDVFILDPNMKNDILYIILQGRVEIYKQGYNGSIVNIREYGPFTYFGEMEIFNNDYKTLTVKAKTNCKIYQLSGVKLKEWIRIEPELGILIIEELTKRLAETSKIRLKLTLMTIKERVLSSLYYHYKLGSLNTVTKKMLCNETATPIRSLNRIINDCQKEGILEYDNKHFTINKIEDIKQIVEQF
ncbi:Crp/Fnr family transcriptional regulator [Thiospirochaeta perfilievii]|nr:Crp/Fnr family transcriptional regulator [Thiospirochaeta perfilievii]